MKPVQACKDRLCCCEQLTKGLDAQLAQKRLGIGSLVCFDSLDAVASTCCRYGQCHG